MPALSTSDGQQKYWIEMTNASYGKVQYNLTVGENILVKGSLNVTGVSYLGDLTFNAENVSFKNGGDLFSNASSIYYNNGTQIFDLTIKNIPENAIMSFNQVECPAGWVLADGTGGTPDLRGIFIRGSGTSSIVKYANGSFMSATYGEYYNDSLQGHWHKQTVVGTSSTGPGAGSKGVSETASQLSVNNATELISDGTNGEPRTGAETAPASYALIYCVKTAEDSQGSNSIWQTIGNLITPVNSSKDFAINTYNLYVNVTSGNVGIGTNNPANKFVLNSNMSNNGFYISNSLGNNLYSLTGDGSEDADFFMRNSSGSLIVRLNTNPGSESYINNGEFGIGTNTPTQKLDVNGSVVFDGVTEFNWAGHTIGNQEVSHTFTHVESSVMEITAMFSHYGYITQFGTARKSLVSNGQGAMHTIDTHNIATANAGSWTFTKDTPNQITIKKTAGSYDGGGYYFINVKGNSLISKIS